jgi:hypothetical protein
VAAIKAEADRHAANVLPIIREAQRAGAETLRDVADALNRSGYRHSTRRQVVRDVREKSTGSLRPSPRPHLIRRPEEGKRSCWLLLPRYSVVSPASRSC